MRRRGGTCKTSTGYLLAAAKALGVPAECLVLEDSPNGLRAARAAGCKAIVVPDITHPPESEGLWAARGTLADVIPLWNACGHAAAIA
ncbi:MAG: HAD-IA family hydrolase [Neglectibacter timonensis]